MNVVVVGDWIEDAYQFTRATRLCPEAPVPVLIPTATEEIRTGGAALVVAQLDALNVPVKAHYGSFSRKKRIFADNRLICRIDEDRLVQLPDYVARDAYENRIIRSLEKADLLIISDYDKGALTRSTAARLLRIAKERQIPVFVDAKNNWRWYDGGDFLYLFPNKNEHLLLFPISGKTHVIRKLGKNGCEVDGVLVPTTEQIEFDCTGAGDCFIAAFAYWLLKRRFSEPIDITPIIVEAAQFANRVAGISVKYVGTHVVKLEEIDGI